MRVVWLSATKAESSGLDPMGGWYRFDGDRCVCGPCETKEQAEASTTPESVSVPIDNEESN